MGTLRRALNARAGEKIGELAIEIDVYLGTGTR